MKLVKRLSILSLVLAALAASASAQTIVGPPTKIDYQGKVLDSNGNPLAPTTPTNYTMAFRIWDAQTGGAVKWSETQTVTVSNGIFSVRLGEGTAISGENNVLSAAAVFSEPNRFLGVTVATTVGDSNLANYAEITPRLTFLTSPFSFVAQNAVNATNATNATLATTATTANLVNQTAGTSVISAANITTGSIGTATVTNANITTGTITNGTITNANILGGTLRGDGAGITNLNGASLQNSTVTDAKISGVFSDARLSANVAFRNQANTFTGNQFVNAALGVGVSPSYPLHAYSTGPLVSVTDGNSNAGTWLAIRNQSTGGKTWQFISTGSGNGEGVGKMLVSNGTPGFNAGTIMTFVSDGSVGIGTTSPTQGRLTISGFNSAATGTTSCLSPVVSSVVGIYSLTGIAVQGNFPADPISLYASNNILANAVRAFSDERIKLVRGVSDSVSDLSKLMQIEITDFQYRDFLAKGSGMQKKVIAQQVEKVYPAAVSRSTDCVPDIYRGADVVDGWIMLATTLKKGERVRITANSKDAVYEVLEVERDRFKVNFPNPPQQLFVFGREVNDFRTVDYEAIAMLNVSATQEIKKELDAKVERLEKEAGELRAALQAQSKRLAELESKDKTRDAKLAAFEQMLLQRGTEPQARPAAFHPEAQ